MEIKTWTEAEKIIDGHIAERGMNAAVIKRWLVVDYDYAEGMTYTEDQLKQKVDDARKLEIRRMRVEPLIRTIVSMDLSHVNLYEDDKEVLIDHLARNVASNIPTWSRSLPL